MSSSPYYWFDWLSFLAFFIFFFRSFGMAAYWFTLNGNCVSACVGMCVCVCKHVHVSVQSSSKSFVVAFTPLPGLPSSILALYWFLKAPVHGNPEAIVGSITKEQLAQSTSSLSGYVNFFFSPKYKI